MKIARYQELMQRKLLQCHLCPHRCTIGEGKSGRCHVRENIDGELFLKTYGVVSSMNFDPIEKKPLYHFFPGKIIFSVGSLGCNLKCRFCQNWEISQSLPGNLQKMKRYKPEELVAMASARKDNLGIAFTYNEPAIWFEYMYDVAELSKSQGMKNVMVTNGFINSEPLAELLEVIDAFNVDLKAFTEEFYHTQTLSRLAPVKESLKQIRHSGKHLEITNLIIPGLNDHPSDFTSMVNWIARELGKDTVLHLSRYFPNYRLSQPPTPPDTLIGLYELAKEHLNFVYLGNVNTNLGQNTNCPLCGHLLITRNRYDARLIGMEKTGNCKNCNAFIHGCFR
ncbi:MAG: AmmeMemoRadiSam system radical SAM enzyme [Bacteroidales bacterium]|nr:AmmeMemoRadiSam system radical SAM enzyme [Bacteroidales bacterium]